MDLEYLTENLVTAGVEILVVIVLLVLLYVAGRKAIGWLASRPKLERFEKAAEAVRKNLRGLVILASVLCVLAICGFNGWLTWKGTLSHEYTLEQLRSVPPEVWTRLAIKLAEILAISIAVGLALRRFTPLLEALCVRAKAYEGITANDESIDLFFASARKSLRRAAWLGVLAVAAYMLELPAVVADNLVLALEVFLIVAVGMLLWRGMDAAIESLEALSKKYADRRDLLRFYTRFVPLMPLMRRSVEYGIYVGVATLVTGHIDLDQVAVWGPRLIRIIGVVFLSRVGVELVSLLLDEALIARARLTEEQRARRLTILPLIKSILKYGVYFGAAVFVLKELGVNPTPILAGAGIAAMAVGLGAQNLINDMVSGFFILFENYFLVGDYILVGDAQGVVEQIDLRTTRIRDEEGRLHIVRNGQIDNLVNFSKGYTFAVVEVGVAYEADLDRVFRTLQQVGQTLLEDRDDVMEPTRVRGVEAFGESEVAIVTTTKVRPGHHRPVERELRRRIKLTFDAEGIEIPYARRVLIIQDADGASIEPQELTDAVTPPAADHPVVAS